MIAYRRKGMTQCAHSTTFASGPKTGTAAWPWPNAPRAARSTDPALGG